MEKKQRPYLIRWPHRQLAAAYRDGLDAYARQEKVEGVAHQSDTWIGSGLCAAVVRCAFCGRNVTCEALGLSRPAGKWIQQQFPAGLY